MKTFETIDFNPHQCRRELEIFRSLLSKKEELSEKQDLLPLFTEHKQLTALLGTFHPSISKMDRIAHDYDLFGDFTCDFVVGDFEKHAYCFVEFEDARKNSVFSKGRRGTSKWGTRFEQGFSQIVDWAYKLADAEDTDAFEDRFGSRKIEPFHMLVIGRSDFITSSEFKRLEWRRKYVLVNSNHIRCMTYDQLLKELSDFINIYPAIAVANAIVQDINF